MTNDLPPIRVSYSQLATFRDCPLKFKWHYLDGWRETGTTSQNLVLGTIWHLMLEAHYTTIKDYQEAHGGRSPRRGTPQEVQLLADCQNAVARAIQGAEEVGELTEESVEALPWMYAGYQEAYSVDPDWKILDVEYKGLHDMGTIMTPKGPRTLLMDFRIDLIVEDTYRGGVFAIEHKSAAELSTNFMLELDDQTAIYEACFRLSDHPLAKKINGCVRSEAKKRMNVGDKPNPGPRTKAQTLEQRFKRQSMPRTKAELANVLADAKAAAQAAYGGNLPIYSSPNPKECRWKCQFAEAHIEARKGRPLARVMQDFNFEQQPNEWNGLNA